MLGTVAGGSAGPDRAGPCRSEAAYSTLPRANTQHRPSGTPDIHSVHPPLHRVSRLINANPTLKAAQAKHHESLLPYT